MGQCLLCKQCLIDQWLLFRSHSYNCSSKVWCYMSVLLCKGFRRLYVRGISTVQWRSPRYKLAQVNCLLQVKANCINWSGFCAADFLIGEFCCCVNTRTHAVYMIPYSDTSVQCCMIGWSTCRYSQEQPFTALNLEIRNHQHLKESLEQYVKGDLLEGANAYYCERCGKKVGHIHRIQCRAYLPVGVVGKTSYTILVVSSLNLGILHFHMLCYHFFSCLWVLA